MICTVILNGFLMNYLRLLPSEKDGMDQNDPLKKK
jgi:hypothetical protein